MHVALKNELLRQVLLWQQISKCRLRARGPPVKLSFAYIINRVTLIDEYYTSQKCSCCGSQLQSVHRCKEAGKVVLTREDKKSALWGVKKCSSCRDPLPVKLQGKATKGPPRIWHRDANAALNMRNVYFSLLETCQRPPALQRVAVGERQVVKRSDRGDAGAPSSKRQRVRVNKTTDGVTPSGSNPSGSNPSGSNPPGDQTDPIAGAHTPNLMRTSELPDAH